MPTKTTPPPLTEEELTEAVEQAFAEMEVPPPAEPEDPLTAMLARLEAGFEARIDAMERRVELLALKAVEGAIPGAVKIATQQAAAQANSKPPLTMRSGVADNFIPAGGSTRAHLGHYRCERFRAVKIQEFDMGLMDAYKNGDIPWPTNSVGKRLNLLDLTRIQGANIPALDGHIYPTTENQVRCLLEHYKTLPQEQGGMPDLYEDRSIEPFRCGVCQGSTETWADRESWAKHMLYVHGEVVAAA